MLSRLMPREGNFFALFNQHAERIVEGSRALALMITTFTGVLILVLLTLMMFFAIRVGVFEQRVSSNEMRQKLAFHAAASAIDHAKARCPANSVLVSSDPETVIREPAAAG